MPFVERTYHQEGYIADDYFETTIEFVGITLPTHRLPEGDAYLLHATLPTGTVRYSYNHTAPIVGGQFWDPVISSIGNLEKSLIDGSGAIGNRLIPTLGNIIISMENGRNLPITKLKWPDAKFTLLRGPRYGAESLDIGQFQLVFRGTFRDHTWNESEIELIVGDNSNQFDDPPAEGIFDGIHLGKYNGLSVQDGGAVPDLIGKNQPRIFGRTYNVPPTLLHYPLQIYDLGWRRITNVVALYDNMIPLSFAGDFTIQQLFDAPTPQPGTYIGNFENGLIRLGAVPAGKLSAEVQGDFITGFPELDEDLTRILILQLLPLYAKGIPIDNTHLNLLLDTYHYRGGFYIDPNNTDSLGRWLDYVTQSLGAVWMLTEQNAIRFQVFQFNPPYRTITDQITVSRQRDLPLPPAWRTEVRYSRNYNVHDDRDVQSPAINEETRSFALQEWRVADLEDESIKADRSDARTLIVETALNNKGDAVSLRLRLTNLHKVERDIIRVSTLDQNFMDEIGLTVHYQSDFLGIEKDMIVVKKNERISQRETDLVLWG